MKNRRAKRRPGHYPGTSSRIAEHISKKDSHEKKPGSVTDLLKKFGPGIITGASDDDPAGIGTYTSAGASFGMAFLWMAPLTLPLMAAIQYLCAKVSMVSGRGLAGTIKQYYARWILYPLVLALLIANIINAAADLGAIAAAINMFIPIPIPLLVIPVALLLLALQIWGNYHLIARIFRWLTLTLLAYIAAIFFTHLNPGEVLLHTFLPSFRWDSSFLAMLVALFGTTISPYLFFWQSDEEVEEEIEEGRTSVRQRRGATKQELFLAAWDVNIGMFISIVVMYCIILTAATTLFPAGKHDIQSATDAAQALRPLAGDAAGFLLAGGLIGTGCLAVPVLIDSAAYALSETFAWRYGLTEKPGRAWQFYTVIILATLIAILINFIGINPIQALVWSAIINGLLAPPLLLLLMFITNNKEIMGERTNSLAVNILGWVATVLMFAAAIAMLVTSGR